MYDLSNELDLDIAELDKLSAPTANASPHALPSQEAQDYASNLGKRLPTILRILGATAVVIAMYSFLTKGWQTGSDVFRYLIMLGHTGLLTAIALASSRWLKESKGARLLLTLALVSVPANFTILGALIFSQSGAMELNAYPQYVAWSVDNLNTAILLTGIAVLLLIPITLLGFGVLARSLSINLSLIFLASNAALLVPVRDPAMIATMVTLLTVGVLYLSRKTALNKSAAKTHEGIIALSLQLLPLGVLMGRTLWLYSADLFLFTVMTAAVYMVLRQITLYIDQASGWRNLLNAASLIPASAISLLITNTLDQMGILPNSVLLPLGATVSAAMIYDISKRSVNSTGFYRRFASLGMALALIANTFIFNDFLSATACAICGLAILLFGYKQQQRSLFVSGAIMLIFGFAHQLYALVHQFDLGSWATLALFGITAIVVASVMESKGLAVRTHLRQWRKNLANWEH